METRYHHLLSPIRVRDFVLKNRMISSQCISQELQGPQIYPDEPYQRYTADLAKNGAAMVNLTVGSWPDANGKHGPMDQFYMEDRKVLNAFAKQIDRVHAYQSLASGSLMLNFGRTQISQRWDTSHLTFRGDYGGGPDLIRGDLPEITKDQIRRGFDLGARHGAELATMGLDCINVYMSYRSGILATALSPVLNQRQDEYGGSLENRCRLPLEFLAQLRDAVGPNKLIQCQISGIEEPPYGYTLEDFLYFCEKAAKYVDIFQIRGWDGSTSHTSTYNFSAHNPYCLQFAAAFKARNIPALCAPVGGFQDPDDMERFLADGKTDLICMARGFLCDPEFGKKLYQGRGEDIVPCIRCDRCHGAVCSVNPRLGLSHVMDGMFDPPERVKRVAVIGGGPAGMKAALTAAERGHQVTLYEAKDHLGGQLIHADYMSFKEPLRSYKNYLIRQLGNHNVTLRLNTRATRTMLEPLQYDAIIAACGSHPKNLNLPIAPGSPVHAPMEVFGHEAELGQEILVIGGGQTGAETAAHLRQLGKHVTVMTRQARICDDFESHAERVFRELLAGLDTIPHAQVLEIQGHTVLYRDETGAQKSISTDTVILSSGVQPNVDECMEFSGLAPQFFLVGDSDVRVCELFLIHWIGPKGLGDGVRRDYEPNVRHATFTAYTAASQI